MRGMSISAALIDKLADELRGRMEGEVRFDEMTRGLYSTDASIYQISPVGVVFPKSRADVKAAVEVAARHRVPILPRGSGTSLSGQTVAAALVIDFSRFMNRILDIDVARRLVRVEPGVVLDQLNAALAPLGMQFGPDVATSSRANLGGMIGNNSAGSRSVRQGKVIDHVRELTVLLSDASEITCGPSDDSQLAVKAAQPDREGEIYRRLPALIAENRREILARYPRILRRVSGYNLDAFVPEIYDNSPVAPVARQLDAEWPDRREFNLARLVVGAEGTLGTVVEAVLHIVPLPKERGVVLLQFRTIDAALESVAKILDCRPSAVELLDRNIVELSRTNLKYKKSLEFVEGTPEALLIVEFSADDTVQIADNMQLLEQKMRGHPGLECFHSCTRDEGARCSEANLELPQSRKLRAAADSILWCGGETNRLVVEDTAVDTSKLPEFTRRFRKILDKHGITGRLLGDMAPRSAACVHPADDRYEVRRRPGDSQSRRSG